MDKKITKGLAVGALIGGAVTGFALSKQGRALGKKVTEYAEELYQELSKKAFDLAEMSKEKYEELVERVGKEYAQKKQLAESAQKDLVKKLKAKWSDYQVDILFRELKKSFKRVGEKSKASYIELVEEVVSDYAKHKKLVKVTKEKITKDLTARWSEIKKTLEK